MLEHCLLETKRSSEGSHLYQVLCRVVLTLNKHSLPENSTVTPGLEHLTLIVKLSGHLCKNAIHSPLEISGLDVEADPCFFQSCLGHAHSLLAPCPLALGPEWVGMSV